MRIIPPITITDAILLSSNVPETDYAAYVAGTTYAIAARVIVVATHKIYESAQAGNTGHYPPDNLAGATPWWLEVGAVNRWRMLDAEVGSQTEMDDFIEVDLDVSNLSCVALLNLDAVQVAVSQTDDDASVVVFEDDINLVSDSNIMDEWDYCFGDFYFSRNVSIELPKYTNSPLTVTITNTGGVAKCGKLAVGSSNYIGKTSYGFRLGISTYSVDSVDAFGNTSITKRKNSKPGAFDIKIPNSRFEHIYSLLWDCVSEPVVFIGTDDSVMKSVSIGYGYYKEITFIAQHLDYSLYSIDFVGLT